MCALYISHVECTHVLAHEKNMLTCRVHTCPGTCPGSCYTCFQELPIFLVVCPCVGKCTQTVITIICTGV